MLETRQQRRAAERAAVKTEQARHRVLTPAERQAVEARAKEAAARFVDQAHLDKMLAKLPTPEMRASTLAALRPHLPFAVVQEAVN